jgi:mannose-1-phosphate guanylyltransferase
VLEPSVLGRIAGDRKVSIEREVFPAMVADGALYAMDGHTYWIDTGTPAKYLQAQIDLLRGERGEKVQGVHPGARIDEGAIVARSVVGVGAHVAGSRGAGFDPAARLLHRRPRRGGAGHRGPRGHGGGAGPGR